MRTILLLTVFFAAINVSGQKPEEFGLKTINRQTAESIVYFLSHDVLEGRDAGSKTGAIVCEYIVAQFMDIGIKPFNNSYYQPFTAYRGLDSKKYEIIDCMDTVPDYTNMLGLCNLLGFIEGVNKDEYVIVGAHYDHVGIGKAVNGDSIYNGADDNASGVSAVIQIAKAFALSAEKPKRSIIFAFWDGEEIGRLGSKFFVDNFDNLTQLKAYLNFDMIGRNNDEEEPNHVVYFYTEKYPQFGENTKQNIKAYNFSLEPEYKAWDKPTSGSDQASFALKDIPVLWYHTDAHTDYHKPSDHFEKINWNKMLEITKVAFLNMWYLANEF